MTTATARPPAAASPADTERAQAPSSQIAMGKRGLELATLTDLYRFAQYLIKSRLAPKDIDTPEKAVIVIQLGAEVGLSAMQSVQTICVINGRPSLWGDGLLAVAMRYPRFDHGVFKEWHTGTVMKDDWTAHCTVGRIGGSSITQTFSVAQAKQARLWGDQKKENWVKYPKRMLQMRARAFALRDTFPDAIKGMYSSEEMHDAEVDKTLAQLDLSEKPAEGTRCEQLAERLMQPAEPEAAAEDLPFDVPETAPEPDGKGDLVKLLGTMLKALPKLDATDLLGKAGLASVDDLSELDMDSLNDLRIAVGDAQKAKKK